MDVSGAASRRASRAHPRAAAVAAGLRQPLPVVTGSAGAVLSVFGPRPAEETSRVLTEDSVLVVAHAMPEHLRELRDAFGTIGVDPRKAERMTEAFRGFEQDAPEGVRRLLDMTRAGGRAELAFVELPVSVRTNGAAYPHHFGRDFWADLEADPRLRRSFDDQMNWRFQTQAPQIAENFAWSRFRRILDVGGGDGTVLAAILAARPGVAGQVLDLPPTAGAATARFAEAGSPSEPAPPRSSTPTWSPT